MPGENIFDWSTTAATNATADSLINWQEGQPRASVNNSARSMMAAHAKQRNLLNGSIQTAGSANAQTFSSGYSPLFTTIPTGMMVRLLIGVGLTNTAAATLSMDGITAVAIKDASGNNLIGGELVAQTYADFLYNGGNWILLQTSNSNTGRYRIHTRNTLSSGVAGINFNNLPFGTKTLQLQLSYIQPSVDGAALRLFVSGDNGASYLNTLYSYSTILGIVGSVTQATVPPGTAGWIPLAYNVWAGQPYGQAMITVHFNAGGITAVYSNFIGYTNAANLYNYISSGWNFVSSNAVAILPSSGLFANIRYSVYAIVE